MFPSFNVPFPQGLVLSCDVDLHVPWYNKTFYRCFTAVAISGTVLDFLLLI